MCTNMRHIKNPTTGQLLFVKCGKCSSCLQEKANSVRRRILENVAPAGTVCYFITLTYHPNYVPYFRISDIQNEFSRCKREGDAYCVIPVYRNVKYNHSGNISFNRNSTEFDIIHKHRVLYSKLRDAFEQTDFLPLLSNEPDTDKCGIVLYKDVREFFNRWKINLIRDYGIHFHFTYFAATEYGETTYRPHAHVLAWIPSDKIEEFRNTFYKSWPFADVSKIDKYFELARKPASYVSSYVCGHSDIPALFTIRPFSVSHRYSLGFGQNLDDFSPNSINEGISSGNLTYNRALCIDGQTVFRSSVIPKHVINRYFPKYKGFFRDIGNRIFQIFLLLDPNSKLTSNTRKLLNSINHFDCDVIEIFTKLKNAFHRFISNLKKPISWADYLLKYTRVWSIHAANILRLSFEGNEDWSVTDHLYHYTNISKLHFEYVYAKKYGSFRCSSPSIIDYLICKGKRIKDFILDANQFPENVKITNFYEHMYYVTVKKKKSINAAMVALNHYV